MPVLDGAPWEAKGPGKGRGVSVRQVFYGNAYYLAKTFSFRLDTYRRKPCDDGPQRMRDPLLPGKLMGVNGYGSHPIFLPGE